MRLFEILLIILTVLLLLATFKKDSNRLQRMLSGGALLTLGLHFVLEGFRWQMALVYIISGVAAILLFANIRVKRKWLRNSLIILALLLVSVSGIVSALLPVFKLPEILSDVSVGTDFLTVTDSSRGNRKLAIKFWYPTDSPGEVKDKYARNPSESLDGLMGMPGFIFGHLGLVETGAVEKSNVSEKTGELPLVVYSHGGSSTNIDNTALLQAIAAQGYMVMAIDYDFSLEYYGLTMEDATTLTVEAQKKFINQLVERTVPNQVEDIIYVLKEIQSNSFPLTQYIDFENIAYIGHSLGGTTSINASVSATPAKAVINMDGPVDPNMITKLKNPILYLSSYSPDLSDELLEEKGLPDANLYRAVKKYELERVTQLFDIRQDDAFWLRFKHAGHIDFTDVPFMIPMMTTQGYDKQQGHRLRAEVIVNFLNAYLKEDDPFKQLEDNSLAWIK